MVLEGLGRGGRGNHYLHSPIFEAGGAALPFSALVQESWGRRIFVGVELGHTPLLVNLLETAARY